MEVVAGIKCILRQQHSQRYGGAVYRCCIGRAELNLIVPWLSSEMFCGRGTMHCCSHLISSITNIRYFTSK